MSHSSPHIQKLLEDRYYLRDEKGTLLESDSEQMFTRVAYAISLAEKTIVQQLGCAEQFRELMVQNKFLPNTPTLINAGKEKPGTFSGCFVLPVEDSMPGIFDAVKQSAIIMKAGGGVGYSFGHLREKGAIVKTTGHKASGPISFMSVFNTMIDTIAQGGSRRGAAMAVLPVWHPDIEEFISMKDSGDFANFNISVGITDDFMHAVETNQIWELKSPVDDWTITQLDAADLWDKIVEHAWKTGDPGLVFLDTINRAHPLDDLIESTNPCGEIPLRPYESCNLGSINLMEYLEVEEFSFMQENVKYPETYRFDWAELAGDIPTMVRFLDDVIEVNPFPLPEIDKASKESRKIGLGIMGWADVLIKMKIPYDSPDAIRIADKLMEFIKLAAHKASIELAKEKGPYPLQDLCDVNTIPRRNATLLCVAPTGTISRIAGVSSGIEPVFAWYTHHKLVDLDYDEEHWAVKEYMDKQFPNRIPEFMKTANEIPWGWHLQHQAIFQKHVDNSISKTINLSNDAAIADVENIYMTACKTGLKGITIYRDNSKENQPLNKIAPIFEEAIDTFKSEAKSIVISVKNNLAPITTEPSYRKRGPVTVGVTHKVDTGKGKIYITVNYDEHHSEPVEVFIRLGHASTSNEIALAEWAGRLLSLLLKYNIPLESIIRQGNKVFGDSTFWYNKNSFSSFPRLISHLLGFTFEEAMGMAGMDFESMMENGDSYEEEEEDIVEKLEKFEQEEWPIINAFIEEGLGGGYCYNCGSYAIIAESGCKVCQNCGHEECG